MTEEATNTTTDLSAVNGLEQASNIATESQVQATIDDGLNEFRHENGKLFGKFNMPRDLANGYRQIEKEYTKARQENKPAPEKYVFELDEDLRDRFSIDENHPDYQRFVPLFKTLNISQDKANQLMNAYARARVQEEEGYDFEAEMEKIGGTNGAIVQGLVAFAQKNLDKDGVNWLSNKVRTAEDAEFFDRLIKKARGANVSIPEFSVESTMDTEKTAQQYLDEAYAYQKEHERTIGYTPEQQNHYMMLMNKAISKK